MAEGRIHPDEKIDFHDFLSRLDGKPSELTRIAMNRARFCELLGSQIDRSMSGRCFTLGILSTLDAFLDETLDSIITTMGLSVELNDALLARCGTLGLILGERRHPVEPV